MNENSPLPVSILVLIEDYLTGQIDDQRLQELEICLREDPKARQEFVRYAQLHTDLHFELRVREVTDRVVDEIIGDSVPNPINSSNRGPISRSISITNHLIDGLPNNTPNNNFDGRRFRQRAFAIAVGLIGIATLGWWAIWQSFGFGTSDVAWLVNAQNCTWTGGEPPTDLRPGKVIGIDHGLAEFHFHCGARVILEGPTRLELLSGNSARLHYGKLAARMSGTTGFEVLSPQGKIVDLGTEFGIAVSDRGSTAVHVFEGRVEVLPTGASPNAAISLTRDQTAQIDAGTVTVQPDPVARGFVRAILLPPVVTPKIFKMTFDPSIPDIGLRDDLGNPTGLTHRLPGTGTTLPDDDPNLRLNRTKRQLELTTTDSDLNTQYKIWQGEYIGVKLSDLGFTGSEDFSVSVTIVDIPALEFIGQFGLYAGLGSDQNIRGGLLSRREAGQYTQFLVNNHEGKDIDFHRVGLLTTGTDLRMTLRRVSGEYTLTVENLTAGISSTLTTRHPQFLDKQRELFVGVFGANTRSEIRRTLIIKDFVVTVWTVNPPKTR